MGSKIGNKSMYLNKEYMDQKMYLLFSTQNDPRNMLQALDCLYLVLPRLLWVHVKDRQQVHVPEQGVHGSKNIFTIFCSE